MADLTQLVPPKDLDDSIKETVFRHIFCRLASFRNTALLHSELEQNLTELDAKVKSQRKDDFDREIQNWAQNLVENAWMACGEIGGGECPQLDPYTDTSTGHLDQLPPQETLTKILNTVLFLNIAGSKEFSARTRSFLTTIGKCDEDIIVSALKNPSKAIEETQKLAESSRLEHAKMGRTLRMVGVGLGAVAGGVLVGVTGGLAAPLVGAGVATVLGFFGIGGTAVGILASALASTALHARRARSSLSPGSSVICGALFGAYGARSTSKMVERHTREIRDLDILALHNISKEHETLAVRMCVSGWLSSKDDVTAPWKVFSGDDTYALQWEVELLQSLSNSLVTLVKTNALRYIKAEVIKRTVFATLMSSLAPMAILKVGQIIDNDWMNSQALAIKAGRVLGDLLHKRVFGNRPVTLTGYSLGALVIFQALECLAALPPSETVHLIEDVYLFGAPVTTDLARWASIRRLVSGRLVNGYARDDYVLAVLSRISNASWEVAGLRSVDVVGVDNVLCEEVEGHTQWRVMVGKSLQLAGAPQIEDQRVLEQTENGHADPTYAAELPDDA
ncbi:unnamed protein product [Mycena citricolor]|uniref:DUF726-domain-containing protein n=1 Tax=Mycena citricolor TaxID=2018698 RepID=A0AAD2HMP9_9AGAR|nr:unnamed protein product [Mycena citricolor]